MNPNIALKAAILQTGIKQGFLATVAGIDPTRLSKIIHGHVQPAEIERTRISEVLNIPLNELFPEDNDESR